MYKPNKKIAYPSPQDDLQQISMYEDQYTPEYCIQPERNKSSNQFLNGWIKPPKKAHQILLSFQSNLLQPIDHTPSRRLSNLSISLSRKKRSASFTSANEMKISRNTTYRIKRTQSQDYTGVKLFNLSQLSTGENIKKHRFECQKHQEDNSPSQISRKIEVQQIQEPVFQPAFLEAVNYPLINIEDENSQRVVTRSVGRVRRLLKVNLQRKF